MKKPNHPRTILESTILNAFLWRKSYKPLRGIVSLLYKREFRPSDIDKQQDHNDVNCITISFFNKKIIIIKKA